jgi:uncharacterized protein YndB with AHSA1/START domain
VTTPSHRARLGRPRRGAAKLAGWGAGDTIEPREWAFDFRVGGRDVAEGKFHDGPVTRYETTYTDIVEHIRIVTTYEM